MYRHFVVWIVGLSTIGVMAQDLNSALLKPKMWGVGVNARHFGYDLGVLLQRPNMRLGDHTKPLFASSLLPFRTAGFWLGPMKDPREVKVVNERLPGSKPFVIEKVTHNLMFKYQVGRSFSVSERTSRSELGLRVNASLQLPLNYSWPIYIWLYQPATFTDGYVAVEYNPAIHDVGLLGGNVGYFKGFSEGRFTPGVGGSVSMQAEWGSYKNVSNSLSLGVGMDRFVKDLPFWHRPEMNRNFFPTVFVTFAVGFL